MGGGDPRRDPPPRNSDVFGNMSPTVVCVSVPESPRTSKEKMLLCTAIISLPPTPPGAPTWSAGAFRVRLPGAMSFSRPLYRREASFSPFCLFMLFPRALGANPGKGRRGIPAACPALNLASPVGPGPPATEAPALSRGWACVWGEPLRGRLRFTEERTDLSPTLAKGCPGPNPSSLGEIYMFSPGTARLHNRRRLAVPPK